MHKNPAGDDLIPWSLPSGRITLAERQYFETGEGELLVYGFLNLTQLARSTPARARTVVGVDDDYGANDDWQLMPAGTSTLQVAHAASGDVILDILDLKLNVSLNVDFGMIEENWPE